MTDEAHRSGVGALTYLTEEQKRDIYEAAIHVIGQVGMQVDHDGVLALLRDAGATVDDGHRVRIPRYLVEKARSSAPSVLHLYDRTGRDALELGGRHSYFGTGSDLMSVIDLETGERRRSELADVGLSARLCDALPNIDFVMSNAYPNEVDPHRSYVESFRAMLRGTTKPLVVTAESAADLRVMWEIACALRGDAESLRLKPYFVMYGQPSSPLVHPAESMDKMLFCADWGIPAIYSPAPIAGATAPVTVAGHVAQGTAEALFGLVIHQLRRPGSPFLFGIGPGIVDMATSQVCYNAPEYLAGYLCAIEMAKWLDLPNWGYAGTTDSEVVDAQAGLEAAELTFLSMLCGSNLNHDIGYLDWGLTGAPELIVIVDEYIALNRRLLRGVEVAAETLALGAIDEVGPGGNFLASKHTKRHARSAQWRPTILNRENHLRWQSDGEFDLREQARRKARELLTTHVPAPLDPSLLDRIDALVDGFDPREKAMA